MIKVPTLEQQRAEIGFDYDKIILLLFCQTEFDQVMEKREKKVDKELFDITQIEGFLQMTDEQRYEVINAMPTTLQLALMDEGGILDDKHKTIGHKHKLKKIPVSKESKKWQCISKVSKTKCKNEMTEEE